MNSAVFALQLLLGRYKFYVDFFGEILYNQTILKIGAHEPSGHCRRIGGTHVGAETRCVIGICAPGKAPGRLPGKPAIIILSERQLSQSEGNNLIYERGASQSHP